MEGTFTIVCALDELPMTYSEIDGDWHCPIHNPPPPPPLYDWKQETDNG